MPPEAYVLSFDTSAAHCAAALLLGDRVVDHRVEEMAIGQAERLMPLLQEVLVGAGIEWQDISVIGVGTGPGNFTGVRISVAAARGLALGLGVPAVGVTTFEAMALGAALPLMVQLDARRGQVYAQIFGPAPMAARLLGLGEVLALTPDTTVVGEGGAVPQYPLAVAIARIAGARAGTVQPAPSAVLLAGRGCPAPNRSTSGHPAVTATSHGGAARPGVRDAPALVGSGVFRIAGQSIGVRADRRGVGPAAGAGRRGRGRAFDNCGGAFFCSGRASADG